MGKRCSHCGNIGHNSRTCTNYKMSNSTNDVKGLRLFGVQLDIKSSSCSSSSSSKYSSSIAMKKSFSMDSLPCSSSSPFSSRVSISEGPEKISTGYLSDGLLGHPMEKKKGVPWSEEEHKAFLAGLEKLGKGDWRGISRNFVVLRTPTQVASHAQKYFLRQATVNRKRRRSSVFDMVSSDNMGDHQVDSSITKPRSSNLEENNQNHEFSQPSSPNRVMHAALFNPFSSPKVKACPVIASLTIEAPDLELKLGASRLADQNKSPSNPLLIGSITVV